MTEKSGGGKSGEIFDVETAWQKLVTARKARIAREEEEGPDPDSPTCTGLTVAS